MEPEERERSRLPWIAAGLAVLIAAAFLWANVRPEPGRRAPAPTQESADRIRLAFQRFDFETVIRENGPDRAEAERLRTFRDWIFARLAERETVESEGFNLVRRDGRYERYDPDGETRERVNLFGRGGARDEIEPADLLLLARALASGEPLPPGAEDYRKRYASSG